MAITTKSISAHPSLPMVERKVTIFGAVINDRPGGGFVDLDYAIMHEIEGTPISIPFHKEWKFTDNELVTARDAEFNPIPNPEYVEDLPDEEGIPTPLRVLSEEEKKAGYGISSDNLLTQFGTLVEQPVATPPRDVRKEPYLEVPAFTYFKTLLINPSSVSLIDILNSYIDLQDSKGFFNTY